MAAVKVTIIGPSGETGRSIVNGLLKSPLTKFEITALSRPESLVKPANIELKNLGVKVAPADLKVLQMRYCLQMQQKIAGVKRFVQSAFMIVIPPRGVVDFREKKEEILNQVQKIRLSYTYIDAGWWYQISLPRFPSGRIDYALSSTQAEQVIGLDGNALSALADLRDVGRYIARVIADPRTLNKRVYVYNDVFTRNQVYDLLERLSGEKLKRRYVSLPKAPLCIHSSPPVFHKLFEMTRKAERLRFPYGKQISEEEINTCIREAKESLKQTPTDGSALGTLTAYQLLLSLGIRGDNTPENAKYLGYLSGEELYPDFEFTKLEDYIRETLGGKINGVYQASK